MRDTPNRNCGCGFSPGPLSQSKKAYPHCKKCHCRQHGHNQRWDGSNCTKCESDEICGHPWQHQRNKRKTNSSQFVEVLAKASKSMGYSNDIFQPANIPPVSPIQSLLSNKVQRTSLSGNSHTERAKTELMEKIAKLENDESFMSLPNLSVPVPVLDTEFKKKKLEELGKEVKELEIDHERKVAALNLEMIQKISLIQDHILQDVKKRLTEDRTELITKIIKDLSGLIDVVSQKKEDIEPFCTICQNQIEDTSFLPCSHQFCCSCLILYVRGKILDHEKLGYRNLQTLNIPCPNCKVIFPFLYPQNR